MTPKFPSKIHLVNIFCSVAIVGALVWYYAKSDLAHGDRLPARTTSSK